MDMKRENWMITAGFRARWQACYLFDPFAETPHRALEPVLLRLARSGAAL